MDEGELLRLAEQVLESLTVVHQAAVLHRDIKPSNILIRRSDDRPVLIDFGAAKNDFVRYTKSSAPHTQGYAAIEQMEADGKLGPWTDLYGLGAVLWRIVAGGHPSYEPFVPVDALSRMAARFRGQQDPLPSARRLGAGRFSIAVLEAIDKCLELEPRDRPADCGELLRLLSVPVRKGLVESPHANTGKDESGREEKASGEEAEPLLELTVERPASALWGAAALLLLMCLTALYVDLMVRLEAGSNVSGTAYFTRGSHRDDVLRLQGTPDLIDRYEASGYEVWRYGSSTVEISTRDGRVREWSNHRGNLNVR